MERSRGRHAKKDANERGNSRFWLRQPLRVEYSENNVNDQSIENAWKMHVKESFRMVTSSKFQRDATDALKILPEKKGCAHLQKCWEALKGSLMTPDCPYQTLEVP